MVHRCICKSVELPRQKSVKHSGRVNKDSLWTASLMLGVQLANVSTRCSSHPQALQLRAMSLQVE